MQFTVWGEGGNEYIRCLPWPATRSWWRCQATWCWIQTRILRWPTWWMWKILNVMLSDVTWTKESWYSMIFWLLWRGRFRCSRRWEQKDETLHHDMRALWFCVILICILYRLTLFHGTWSWSKHSQHLPYLLVTQPLFAHEASLGALSGWQLWSSFFLLEGETWTWFREELLSERRRFHCYGLEELQLRMVSYGVSPCVTNDNLWKTSTWFSPEISQHLLKKTRLIQNGRRHCESSRLFWHLAKFLLSIYFEQEAVEGKPPWSRSLHDDWKDSKKHSCWSFDWLFLQLVMHSHAMARSFWMDLKWIEGNLLAALSWTLGGNVICVEMWANSMAGERANANLLYAA